MIAHQTRTYSGMVPKKTRGDMEVTFTTPLIREEQQQNQDLLCTLKDVGTSFNTDKATYSLIWEKNYQT